MITKQEIKGLLALIHGFARSRGLTSVHVYRTCVRHLEIALRLPRTGRVNSIRHAYTHFQFLKAAAAEKATRGKA